jgi:hypothetical protein
MDLTFLEDRAGTVSWPALHAVVAAAARTGTLTADASHTLKERLKSEVLPLVLNSLTVGGTAIASRHQCAEEIEGGVHENKQLVAMAQLDQRLLRSHHRRQTPNAGAPHAVHQLRARRTGPACARQHQGERRQRSGLNRQLSPTFFLPALSRFTTPSPAINPPTPQLLKHLERLLTKPPTPGVEAAAAQLLLDWSFLFG